MDCINSESDEWKYIMYKLPEKGRNIEYIDIENNTGYAFRCACSNPNCRERRCVITGMGSKQFDKIYKNLQKSTKNKFNKN